MGIITKIKRYFDCSLFKRLFYNCALNYYKKQKTIEFLAQFQNKKILLVNASPIIEGMFQQRPHHLVNFLKNYFDYVFYISYRVQTPKPFKDNVFEVPYLPVIKTNNKIFYYLSSVNCLSVNEFKELKKASYKVIYDYYDEISDDIANSKNALNAHKILNKLKIDITIASSAKLYNDLIDLKIKNPLLIKNGVTIEDFEKTLNNPPDDIKTLLDKPIVGYYGYLSNWIDFYLIEECLKKLPCCNFVFIGKFINDLNDNNLRKYPNYHYLGYKNYKDLYKYSSFFDCAIIPFKEGKIAKATSPNKLFEYMAKGIPCVCTKDLVECKNYKGVFVSNNNASFIEDIKKAVLLKQDSKIVEFLKTQAKENSWENKANIIIEKIKEIGL